MTFDFDRLRLLWPDHLGLARGKYLTPERAASGASYVDGFVTVKRAEWDRHQRWTTDWEMAEYLPLH